MARERHDEVPPILGGILSPLQGLKKKSLLLKDSRDFSFYGLIESTTIGSLSSSPVRDL